MRQRAGFGLYKVAGRSGSQPPVCVRGIVVHVDDRRMRRATYSEQGRDLGLSIGIVAPPPGGIVEARLHVDHQEGGVVRKLLQACAPQGRGSLMRGVGGAKTAMEASGTPMGSLT